MEELVHVAYAYRGAFRGAVMWTDPDGASTRRTVTGRTAEDARGKLDGLQRGLRLGMITAPSADVTLAEYLIGWIERDRAQVRPSTWLTAESYVREYLIPASAGSRSPA